MLLADLRMTFATPIKLLFCDRVRLLVLMLTMTFGDRVEHVALIQIVRVEELAKEDLIAQNGRAIALR